MSLVFSPVCQFSLTVSSSSAVKMSSKKLDKRKGKEVQKQHCGGKSTENTVTILLTPQRFCTYIQTCECSKPGAVHFSFIYLFIFTIVWISLIWMSVDSVEYYRGKLKDRDVAEMLKIQLWFSDSSLLMMKNMLV